MAKRKSILEDLADISAKLPWWVGVLLALVTYAVLHSVASTEIVAPKGLQGLGDSTVKQFIKIFAMFLQYLVPIAFLLGAGASAYGRWKRGDLHFRVVSASNAGVLQDMSWQEFEMLVGEAFRRKGFAVRETGGGGPDGGVDLVLSLGSDKYLVQCKQWRAPKVGVTAVRELFGVMAATHASGGYVVTSGEFTNEAAEFAKGRNIELIEKKQLMALIQDVHQDLAASGESGSRSDPWSNPVADAESVARAMTPSCPDCGRAMTLRVAKRGTNAGSSFWGCTTYPRCKGTRPAI